MLLVLSLRWRWRATFLVQGLSSGDLSSTLPWPLPSWLILGMSFPSLGLGLLLSKVNQWGEEPSLTFRDYLVTCSTEPGKLRFSVRQRLLTTSEKIAFWTENGTTIALWFSTQRAGCCWTTLCPQQAFVHSSMQRGRNKPSGPSILLLLFHSSVM